MATPIRHIPEAHLPHDTEDIDLWEVALGIWNAKWLILGGTLVAALAAGIVSSRLPKVYEATATVYVTAPTFSSPLQSPPLSVEAYARLAESGFIKDLVTDELRKNGTFSATQQVGGVRTVLYPSREPQKPFLPLVGLIAEGFSPELAQKIANTWATRLIQEQERLSALSTTGSVAFIVTEYPKAVDGVANAERQLRDLRNRHAAELSKIRLDTGIDPRRGSQSNVVVMGTPRTNGETTVDNGLSLLLAAEDRGPKYDLAKVEQQTALDLERRLAATRIDLETSRHRLAQLEAELARNAPFVNGPNGAMTSNPLYTTLSEQVSSERVRLNSLGPTVDSVSKDLAAARSRAEKVRSEFLTGEVQVENLQRRQGVEQLVLERELAEARAKLKPLEDRIGDAALARDRRENDLKLGALATLPRGAVRPNVALNAATAGAVGFVLSLIGAWILSRGRNY